MTSQLGNHLAKSYALAISFFIRLGLCTAGYSSFLSSSISFSLSCFAILGGTDGRESRFPSESNSGIGISSLRLPSFFSCSLPQLVYWLRAHHTTPLTQSWAQISWFLFPVSFRNFGPNPPYSPVRIPTETHSTTIEKLNELILPIVSAWLARLLQH